MKAPVFFAACAAAVLSLSPGFAEEEKPHTELGKQMEAVGDAYKAIRKESDPAKGAELARQAQEAVLKSLTETPERIAQLPEDQRPKALANYRTMLGKVFVGFSEIEEAFLANDLAKVKTLMESQRALKKEGHEKYSKED
ncbi:MAG TPA: cytochrome b562 [Rariglobus sp.]